MNDWIERATQACLAWGGLVGTPCLAAQRENTVLDVRLTDGTRAALRFHRVGYQSAKAIEAELIWMEALTAMGFPCPRPIRTLSGDLICQQDVIVSAVRWIDAPTLVRITDTKEQIEHFMRLGALLAKLHNLTDQGADLPQHSRPVWHCDAMCGSDPLWGRYWEHPLLNAGQTHEMLAARDIARDWLGVLTDPDIGAIHADPIGENVLIDKDQMWLIDFDDAGHGYRLYDLGVALTQHWNTPHLHDLIHALCKGYAKTRDIPLSPLLRDVPRFMALRALQSAGWIIPRAAPDDPKQMYYVTRALACAEQYFLQNA